MVSLHRDVERMHAETSANVAAPDREMTYDKPVGGIMTVTSELGEPIHKVATRGVKLWGEFDKTVFALPREKQAAWLKDHKQYVIDRLNADFQKPWVSLRMRSSADIWLADSMLPASSSAQKQTARLATWTT